MNGNARGIFPAFVAGVGVLASMGVSATTYSSGMADGRWQLSASVFECRLYHEIPAFGSASFVRRAGEPESFRLRQEQPLLSIGDVLIQAAPPAWQPESRPQLLAQAKLEEGPEIFRTNDAMARQLQSTLESRKRLMFTQTIDGRGNVRVLLEPLGFIESFADYKGCLKRLLPVNFSQVERTSIYFPIEGDSPVNQELRKLDSLMRYVKADPRVKQIFIDGHTDSDGVRPENLDISKQRAELIANYLVEKGIAESMLVTRWHGERYPVVSNKTAEGRAQNRRVTLRLERNAAQGS